MVESGRLAMEEKTVTIPNISCGHCVATVKREVEELEGVRSVEGDSKTKSVTFRFEAPATWRAVVELLGEIGYPPAG